MKTRKNLITKELIQYLRALPDGPAPSTATFVAKGAALVTNEAILTIREMLPAIRKKLYQVHAPSPFVQSVELLAIYFEESLGAPATVWPARQQTTFALLYFLKGYDRIPDSIPEIGYVDDAAVVNQVIENQRNALREHWAHRNWAWPATV
jgi:uncharacterized membrane protein YkvA (DUF1232 family)